VNVKIVNKPDLDILLYLFNINGNTSLDKMNKFNQLILEQFSFKLDKVTGAHEFLVSSTELHYDIYGNAVNSALKDLGISIDDWTTNVKYVNVLRSSVVTPLVTKEHSKRFYWDNFIDSIIKSLEKIIREEM